MSRQQWQQVWRIYACAREMDSCRQRSFVESETADPDIVERVLELLESPPDTNEMGTPPPPVDRVGSEFGRYRVTRLLGRGGMGEVYAARDSDLGRTVALKFLLPQGIGDPHHVQGFIREAKAASALNHPNILTVYEVIQSSSGMAIAMEMVEGRALAEFRGSALALAQVAEMGRQVAAALAVAHEQGIVHRDIKPENLMVRPDGLVKVLDFGLARNLAGESAATLNSFASGAPAGTMRYMSPEQLRDGAVTGASDVFALGVVLYELAAGGHPFESAYAWEMANAIGSREPSPPSEMNPELPVWLDELLLSMLKRDPVQRPPAHRVSSILANCSRAASRPNRRRSMPSPLLPRCSLQGQLRYRGRGEFSMEPNGPRRPSRRS